MIYFLNDFLQICKALLTSGLPFKKLTYVIVALKVAEYCLRSFKANRYCKTLIIANIFMYSKYCKAPRVPAKLSLIFSRLFFLAFYIADGVGLSVPVAKLTRLTGLLSL